jgi:cation diffusion facilitator family transporter
MPARAKVGGSPRPRTFFLSILGVIPPALPDYCPPVDSFAERHLDTERRTRQSAALVARGIWLNALLAVVKLSGGVLGHTYALIADGVESLLDVCSSSLVWAGLRVAARPPDRNHPYGHGKAEPLAGMFVSLLVLGAATWIGWHAIREIQHPHRAPHWGTLPLLAFVVGIKLHFSRRLDAAARSAHSTSLGIERWHHYADALTSAAAFVGIAIGIIGGEGYESADDWGALAACLIIGWNGVRFLQASLDDVMDLAASADFERDVRALAGRVAGVHGIDKCRVRKSGLSHLVDIHVEVDGDLSVREGHDIAGAVKYALLGSPLGISDVVVHVEPAEREPQPS